MTYTRHGATRLLAGRRAYETWLAAQPERRTATVVDARIADAVGVRQVEAVLAAGSREHRRIVLDRPDDLASVLTLADRILGADLVVGIGGGTVLDAVKLAAACTDPALARRLLVRQRGGLVVIPPAVRRVATVLAPTTLGTGSELSPNACLGAGNGKRLVMGDVLRADAAVLEPQLTATLPAALLREGTLEALFRIVSPLVGDPVPRPVEDALALAAAEQLVRLGDQLARQLRDTGSTTDGLRLQIATLSGFGHTGWTQADRDPYCAKGWFVANELSWSLGLRKMTAVAAVLPALWRAIGDGDTRWGSAVRLAQVWSRISDAAARSLPADPAAGIAALVDGWGIEHRIPVPSGRLDAVAGRVVRSWGGGLPMLGSLTRADVRALLAEAVADMPRAVA